MPLLRRQPFHKQKAPAGLRPDEEVFVCKLTGELFRDYEKFFERIILCNSLVWTCEITGKSGLTYQEAVESEEKASQQVSTFSDALQKAVLYLVTTTHRSRLNDLDDDIYSFVKDRYFMGEVVEVLQLGEKKKCKVIKVIPPVPAMAPTPKVNGLAESGVSTDSDSDVVCLDDPPKPKSPKKTSPKKAPPPPEPAHPDDYEYVVQELRKSNIYVVKAELINRKKGAIYTREKSKLYLKTTCAASSSGIWKVREKHMKKFKLADAKFTDFFDGPAPVFKIQESKRKPSGSRSGNFIDLTEEDKVIAQAKKQMKEKKKKWKEIKKMEKAERRNKKRKEKRQEKKKSAAAAPAPEPSFDELRKLSAEEKLALKEREKEERLAARQATTEERKAKREEEKQRKKEERDKERDKRREEKQKRDDYLKEWSKAREDLECDDLKALPTPVPVSTHIPTPLFGDAVMVTEYLHAFQQLLDLSQVFPSGVSIGELSRALVETDTNGLLYDILRLLLTTLFTLQEEEDQDDDDDDIDTTVPVEVGENKSFKALVTEATVAAQWPQQRYSTTLKQLPIDNFTVTEILRLHFLSSGAKSSDDNARFRYQQRGAYTDMDDAGLEFRREETAILRLLSQTNVFDLCPADKLKILSALITQLLTFVASRDTIEDNVDKLKAISYDLRHHRWAEQRRDREEAAYLYKKRLEERAKEKELELQRKEERKRARLEKLATEEGAKGPEGEADKPLDAPTDPAPTEPAPSDPAPGTEPERHSARQAEKVHAKQDAEFFDTPIENIQWDKVTAEDRVRMKEKYLARELDLMELADKLQKGAVVAPLGRDRTYRRYWAFRSVAGLFVEDDESQVPAEVYQAATQISTDAAKEDGNKEDGNKSTSSDKENESFELPKADPVIPVNGAVKPVLSENVLVNGDVTEALAKSLDEASPAMTTVAEQIAARGQVCWAYYTPDQVDALIDGLNARGYREGALKATLQEHKPLIMDKMQDLPTDALTAGTQKATEKHVRYQNVKSRNKTMQGAVKNDSAQEFLELNLREMLLDIEERIYVGLLGGLKVKKRDQWRDAIEQGSYAAQCDEISFCGQTVSGKKATKVMKAKDEVNGAEIVIDSDDDEDDDDTNPAVMDLAKALLQIVQGIEDRFLCSPLGEDEDTKKQKQKAALEAAFKAKGGGAKATKGKAAKKDDQLDGSDNDEDAGSEAQGPVRTPLERFTESLLASTSMSQIFLHLSVLEGSITWAKSALHARCRICRRKGDGDKMLLCDGCDRGHHMYCLKPAVKKIPNGDWYCPDCRPKDVPKTPRKRRNTVFEEEQESSDSDDDSSDDDDSSSDDDDSDDSSDEETEDTEEEEEEPSPPPAKVKLGVKGKAAASTDKSRRSTGRGTAEKSTKSGGRRSADNSRPGSRAASQEREPRGTKAKRRLDAPPSTSAKVSRRSLDVTPARGRKAETPGNRRSLDSVRGKRKRNEEEEDDLPEPKKLVTKSRGGEKEGELRVCEDLLVELTARSESWPFLKPVSRRDAPDYFDIVKTPMDLATMRNKLNRYEYADAAAILADVRLTLRNCEQYNMPTVPEYQAGQKLTKYFEKRVRELGLAKKTPEKPSTANGPSPRNSRRR